EVNEEVGEEINKEENPEVDECNVIININHWFNYYDDELTEILGEKELFPEENIEKENINIDFDDTEYKKIMDDIKLLLSQNVTDKFDNILLLLKNELHEIDQYLNKEEIKSIYDELYSKFKSYLNNMNNIKDKLGSISEELNKISLEEGGILNDIKSSGNFYYNIDLYINEIKQIFKEIDKILDNVDKNNSNS
ncbi:hypothetical protein LG195_20615, partial [Proteus terrae]|uniref:hypothetical protein n=1 Tax=Proteus terrae TaxID=1574161 RepID=UPI00207C3362